MRERGEERLEGRERARKKERIESACAREEYDKRIRNENASALRYPRPTPPDVIGYKIGIISNASHVMKSIVTNEGKCTERGLVHSNIN